MRPLRFLSTLSGTAAAGLLVAGCTGVPPAKPAPAPTVTAPAAAAARPRPAAPVNTAEITSDCGIGRFRESVLKQVNAARASARSCGAVRMRAAKPLAWNRALAEAAEQHSVDMVVHGYFEHVSPDGKRVGQRVAAQGYKWRAVGENLAGGDRTVSDVISGWLGSPDHCENLMSPGYTEVGVACVRQAGSKWGTYWTLVLARPR